MLYMRHMKALGIYIGMTIGVDYWGLDKVDENKLCNSVSPCINNDSTIPSFTCYQSVGKNYKNSTPTQVGMKHLLVYSVEMGKWPCLNLVEELLLLLLLAGMIPSFLHSPLDSSSLSNARHNLESVITILIFHVYVSWLQ